ncbi:MAG: N-6 DNA methylase [Lachnospiraceae bacterium]|nr:N-6 DNA methylase [Lachnospiraceae bacterium]
MELNDVVFNENGDIIDVLSGKILKDTPEERVRQRFINILEADYGYPKKNMLREVPIQNGSKIMTNSEDGSEIRADIVVYVDSKSALNRDQGNILFVVECKKPNATEGYAQLVSYIFNTSAVGGVWTNGDGISVYKKKTGTEVGLDEVLSLPRYGDNWNEEEGIPRKQDLPRPHNVRFLLSSCHNKLYGRGMENEDFDLAMDMVRILLAKIQDETTTGDYPRFWITETDFRTAEGRNRVAENIQSLFREYADQYPDVFDAHEKIQVGNDCIAEAVGILKGWSLAARNDDADDWDLMGETYEQFTHINLKRQQGQFFTNRLVVNMMVDMLDPQIGEHALDPAGGSGGFATSIFRHLRRKVVENTAPNTPVRDRQITTIKESVYLVEIAARLVKIAKCAMLLTGDGQSGMTRGNSLDTYERLDPWIVSRCSKGKTNAPSVIATNPPFSGQKVESQISDRSILKQFDFGHSFKKDDCGKFVFSNKDADILIHQAPELLFLERCIDWLKPEGRIGIVLPKGFLDNVSYEAYREWLLDRCELNGVVTLHKDTFQPDTGVRTCILFLTKPKEGQKPKDDYKIFMAQSQRIGQDSKGNSVFVLDANGNITGKLNHDLDDIAEAYRAFKNGQEHKKSEYIFSISKSEIKDYYNINPQHYSPKLNEALNKVLDYDNKDDWSTTTIGQLEAGIRIYIGPRWNSASIKVDNPIDTSSLTPYLTANGALELRRFSIKWMDESKASTTQKKCIEMLKVEEGDILITRSGTIGKVTYATKDLADIIL